MTNLFKKLNFHTKEWIIFGLCIISIITGIIAYPLMPSTIVSHWGANGQPNGYLSAFWGSFILPLVILGMFFLLIFIPRADPLKENINMFKKYFLNFLLILFVFMYALQIFMIFWNLGYQIEITFIIIPLFAILFFYLGIMLSKTKQNMSIGIRTPWTLKSEKSWDETHKRASVLIKIVSVIFLLGLIFRKQAFIILLVPLLAVFLYSFVYSYVVYEKEHSSKNKHNNKSLISKKK
jgi:uncharacterized membrane protein